MANNIPILEKVKGTIESVKHLKSGKSVKDGRSFDWSLFEVTIGGKTFRTFDPTFSDMVGQTGEWEYKKETRQGQKGSYESRTLSNLTKAKGNGQDRVKLDEILENQKEILGLLRKTDVPEDYEPKPEELPQN